MNKISVNRYARIAGLGYLGIIVSGIFAEFVVRGRVIVPGDATSTAANIGASEQLFRIGMAADLFMLLCDVGVALALYVILKEVDKNLAMLAAWLRLVHASIYGANLLNLVIVLLIVGGAGYMAILGSAQSDALVLLFLNAHKYGYALGLVFFGAHCLVLGYLVFKSRMFPKILGILLLLASVGYPVDSFGNVLLSNYTDYETILTVIVFAPAFIGEFSFALWLLIRGARGRIE